MFKGILHFFNYENRLNGLENGKTQLFNWGVVKWAYFQKKKVEYPFKTSEKYI